MRPPGALSTSTRGFRVLLASHRSYRHPGVACAGCEGPEDRLGKLPGEAPIENREPAPRGAGSWRVTSPRSTEANRSLRDGHERAVLGHLLRPTPHRVDLQATRELLSREAAELRLRDHGEPPGDRERYGAQLVVQVLHLGEQRRP